MIDLRKVTNAILAAIVLAQFCADAKVLDLSTSSDVSGEYEIGFCARPSPDTKLDLPGHSFVTFSHRPRNGGRTFIAVGHTVSPGVSSVSAIWSYVGEPVSGYVKEEIYTSMMQRCLLVRVDKADFNAAYGKTKSPLEKLGLKSSGGPMLQAYKLGSMDCMEFMIDVANVLARKGLKIPSRLPAELPLEYMVRFTQSN